MLTQDSTRLEFDMLHPNSKKNPFPCHFTKKANADEVSKPQKRRGSCCPAKVSYNPKESKSEVKTPHACAKRGGSRKKIRKKKITVSI
jgi:hypothetical protein